MNYRIGIFLVMIIFFFEQLQAACSEPKAKHHFKYITVNVFNNVTMALVPTDISLKIDLKDAKVVSRFPSNTTEHTNLIQLNELKKSYLIIRAPSFKTLHFFFDIERALDSPCFAFKANDSVLVLNVVLQRPTRGEFLGLDIQFFSDSQVMQKKSKPSLDQVHAMLLENPKMRIRIHGHTHSNHYGKINTLKNPRSKELKFFDNNARNEKEKGSAKKLSEMRAEAVKLYLESKGIPSQRVEIMGWGANEKKVHVEEDNEELAVQNMRVEVEVIED